MFCNEPNSEADRWRPGAGNLLRALALALFLGTGLARGQSCQAGEELENATKTSFEAAALPYFGLAAKGDVAGLRSFAIPSVADSFSGIAQAVQENQAALAEATATVRSEFLLTVAGDAPPDRVEFLCGVFGKSGQTASSAVFTFNNLPPGRYGVVILDATGKATTTDTEALAVAFILQEAGATWKLGGFYLKPTLAAGHDSKWFTERARAFAAKGQNHNAWYYLLEARNLASVMPFMSTRETDRLFDESQKAASTDAPDGIPIDLSSAGKGYKPKSIFAYGIAGEVNLVVKYELPDVSDGAKTYAENLAVAHALVSKWPELREGFGAIIARATEPSGKDFGTLVDIKSLK